MLTRLSLIVLSCAALICAKSVTVGTFDELANAVSSAAPGDTILLQDGTYTVNNGYGLQVRVDRLTIRSLSDRRDKVIVQGEGMAGGVGYGFWIPAQHVTIQGLTICNVAYHCIQTDVGNHGLRVINCVLRDAYQQLLKVPFSDAAGKSDSGYVEGCLFEFTKGVADNFYTGGIDVHRGKDWIVRNNIFRDIRSPADNLAEHAIHFWNQSENILVENNLIVNCDRGIGFGMGDQAIHQGGIIRNNMIYHRAYSGTDFGDVGIGLEACVDVRVYNNTIYFDNDYPNAIEYRFAATNGNYIANNCTNRSIAQRDGASATVENNVTDAQDGWFIAPETGDLHLASSSIAAVIDRGIAVAGLTADFDNNPRPQDSGIDIGADEYTSSAAHNGSRPSTQRALPAAQKRLYLRYNNGAANLPAFDLKGCRIGSARANTLRPVVR